MGDRWIDIDERMPVAPEDGRVEILIYVGKGRRPDVAIVSFDHDTGTFLDRECNVYDREMITHWQPLPVSPKERRPMDRLASVDVSDSLICQALRHGTPATEVIEDPLPEDAELVAVELRGTDSLGPRVRLTFRSESFAPVAPGEDIPKFFVMFKRLDR